MTSISPYTYYIYYPCQFSIRKELPEYMAEEFGVRKLHEEEFCLDLLERTERFLSAIKRITQVDL